MSQFNENQITKLIIDSYHRKLTSRIANDVVIIGAGPAGLTAGALLSRQGFTVTVIEKRVAPGGGIWGGGMGMNEVVFQEAALPILDDFCIRHEHQEEGLYTTDAAELASGLVFKAVQSGVVLLSLITFEDVSVHDERVTGVVVNRTGISGAFPVDPLTLSARAVIDTTGHEAVVVDAIRRRGFFHGTPVETSQEGPMNASEGEDFVASKAGMVYPGLWVAGMSVCAAFGGPRMGPIFGGMLLSGQNVAGLIAKSLKEGD